MKRDMATVWIGDFQDLANITHSLPGKSGKRPTRGCILDSTPHIPRCLALSP